MKNPILAALAVMVATSATAEDLTTLEAEQTAYVDPMLQDRQRCKDRPGKPGWMMVRPLGYEWRGDLANKFRTAQFVRGVTDAGMCNCDLLYPDWDAYRDEVEALWNEVSTEKGWDWDDETRQRYYEAQDSMTDYSRPLLRAALELCEGVE